MIGWMDFSCLDMGLAFRFTQFQIYYQQERQTCELALLCRHTSTHFPCSDYILGGPRRTWLSSLDIDRMPVGHR